MPLGSTTFFFLYVVDLSLLLEFGFLPKQFRSSEHAFFYIGVECSSETGLSFVVGTPPLGMDVDWLCGL